MPYCYACRNDKPATHAHFLDHGILAMRPPKRHITDIEALWDSMTDAQQSRALEEGRQFLARAGEQTPRQRANTSTSRGTGNAGTAGARRPRQQAQERQEEGEEGEGSPWGLLAIGAVVLGGIGWLFWQGRGA